MTLSSNYQTLFSYHFDKTLELLEQAEKLEEVNYQQKIDYGRGALHALFFHLLRADSGWRIGLETGQRPSGLKAVDFPDPSTLIVGFKDERLAWERYLQALTDEQISGEFTITTRPGHEVTFELWRILQHLILHGMQHHSEIAKILTDNGRSPGDIDFIFWREITQ